MAKIATTEHKIFDPRDGILAATGDELLDASVVKRGDTWVMYLAGQARGQGAPNMFSATLPKGAPLSAKGWQPVRGADGELQPLVQESAQAVWSKAGGRHCPAYVKGWDSNKKAWVERLYFAGGKEFAWGPYGIGYLEWNGSQWVDTAAPCFEATEDWEHGSVYEPNLIWHDGTWRMWYVAGSSRENYLVHGYAESKDGINWSKRTLFAPASMQMFDFCVRPRGNGYVAIFARLHIGNDTPSPETGLWLCHSETPSGNLKDWSEPVQIMTAEDKGWHQGAFKPSFQLDDIQKHAWIFFDGKYNTGEPGPFPFALTLGCLEIDLY